MGTCVCRGPSEIIADAGMAGGCVLCDSPDFQRGGFGDRTMIICDQCEREFHIGCLAEHGRAQLTELPAGAHPSTLPGPAPDTYATSLFTPQGIQGVGVAPACHCCPQRRLFFIKRLTSMHAQHK